MLQVGQKVVCVGCGQSERKTRVERPQGEKAGAIYPTIGSVYTIRQIDVWNDGTTILLNEISNAHLIGWKGGTIEPGFPAKGFRPVVDRKTDISVFKAMLNPSKTPEVA